MDAGASPRRLYICPLVALGLLACSIPPFLFAISSQKIIYRAMGKYGEGQIANWISHYASDLPMNFGPFFVPVPMLLKDTPLYMRCYGLRVWEIIAHAGAP